MQTGTAPDRGLEDCDAAFALMQTNVLGALNTIDPLMPKMLKQKRGQIAFMSSIEALYPLPDSGAVCARKAAILSNDLALRRYLYDAGVRVTVIVPGYVDSPMTA